MCSVSSPTFDGVGGGSEGAPTPSPTYLYRVNCLTPDVSYIGITNNPKRRLREHRKGQIPFTKKYGVGRLTVLAIFGDRNDAERAEWAYWRQKRQVGLVGGFSVFAEFWGLGLA